MRKFLLSACLFLGALNSANAQYVCGTLSFEEEVAQRTDLTAQEKESLIANHLNYEKELDKRAEEISKNKSGDVYIVPVVFHIFHNGGPENLDTERVVKHLEYMTNDFNARNKGIAGVRSEFTNIIGDAQIEFRLATKDPNGNCTNGINRIQVDDAYYSDRAPIETNKRKYIWPRDKYLNIFTVGSIGGSDGGGTILGYAQFPGGGAANTDGLVMLYSGIGIEGGIQGSTATHEIGHWFNLRHTWGDCAGAGEQAACGCDDGVTDTPNTKGSPSICNLNESACGSLANVQNFMDYSSCPLNFTTGQANRMRAALESTTAGRRNLWQAANLIATGTDSPTASQGNLPVCKALFLPKSNKPICAGSTMGFKDYSYSNVSSWNWTFEGAEPATSSEQNPTVSYNNPGVYKVSLSISDGVNTVDTTMENVVTVLPTSALNIPYSQSFEDNSALSELNNELSIINKDNDRTWIITSATGNNSKKSITIANRLTTVVDRVDEIVSNTFDISQMLNPVLEFKYAHASKANTNTDELAVYVTNDCGTTYKLRTNLKATSLRTAPNVTGTSSFIPNSEQWKTSVVALKTLKSSGFRFKFAWKSGGGNDVFLDSIRIYEKPSGFHTIENNHLISSSLYPNPTNNSANFNYEISKFSTVSIKLVNIFGQELRTIFNGTAQAGQNEVIIEKQGLNNGIYFLKLTVNDQVNVSKLVFE